MPQQDVLCQFADVQEILRVLDQLAAGRACEITPAQVDRLRERLRTSVEYNEAADVASSSFDAGLDAARRGEQAVVAAFDEPACSDIPEAWLEDERPVCRISWFENSGDDSVGLPAMRGWQFAADQSGTQIERFLRGQVALLRPVSQVRLSELEQRYVVLRLKTGVKLFGKIIDGLFCEYHPDVDRFVQVHLPEAAMATILAIED